MRWVGARLHTACGCTKDFAVEYPPPPEYVVPIMSFKVNWRSNDPEELFDALPIKRVFKLYNVESSYGQPLAHYREEL